MMIASRPFAFAGVSLAAVLALAGITPVRAQQGDPAAEAPIGSPGRLAIEKKMKAIFIPEVNFDNTSFVEAVDFLVTESKTLDTAESDKDKKGVRVGVLAARGSEYPRVTLKLKNVSLEDALKRLADVSHSVLRISPTGLMFTTKDGTETVAAPAPEASQAASRVKIETVDVSGQSLESVVEFLNKKSAESKGPSLLIGEGVDPKANVKELRLRNTTLAEVTGYLCQILGYGMKTDGDALSIVPR